MYHSVTDDGHFCPRCGAGPFQCFIEDGQCDNAGICDECVKADVRDHWEQYARNAEAYDGHF